MDQNQPQNDHVQQGDGLAQPQEPLEQSVPPEEPRGGKGKLVTVIILILIFVLALYVFWPSADSELESAQDLEEDLEGLDDSEIEAELDAIDAEFE
ncbi:MAG: hypothetical protein WDZ79_01250 [Candidatus Paceibacterota bacterium]